MNQAKLTEGVFQPPGSFRGLPPSWYVDPQVWALEVDRIWRREWHCIGRADQVPEAGDFLCVDFIDEPLVMIRGAAPTTCKLQAQRPN